MIKSDRGLDSIFKDNATDIVVDAALIASYAKILSETGDQKSAEALIEKTVLDARNENDSDLPVILKKAVEIYEMSNKAKALEYAELLAEHRRHSGNAGQQAEANELLNRINEAINL
jgi:hypothetical protein